MGKLAKRLVSVFMVLSFMSGLLVSTAAADDGLNTDSSTTVTVEITNDNGDVIGEKTTVTSTNTSFSEEGYSKSETVDSNWQSSDSSTSSTEPVTDGNVTTGSSNTVTVDVSGSENISDNVGTDEESGKQTVYGNSEGSETTIVTDTTTDTTTTEDALLDSNTDGPHNSENLDEGEWSDLTLTEEGQWEKTGGTDGQFKQDGNETEKNHGKTGIDVDNDPLDNEDVTLDFNAPSGNDSSKDSAKLYISIEDALANDISYKDGQVLSDGSVVSIEKDSSGNVTGYTITSFSNQSDNKPEDVAVKPDNKVVTDKVGDVIVTNKTPIDPDTGKPYETCENVPIMEDGVQVGVKTVTASTDPETGIISYTVTKETWEIVDNAGTLSDVTPEDIPEDSFVLPEEPVAPDPVYENGLITTWTVEKIIEDGKHVGYVTTSRVTDAQGTEYSRESESIYGTYTYNSSNIERLPDYDRVTTTTVTTVYGTLNTQNYTKTDTGSKTIVNTRDVREDEYQLVDTKDGMFFLYEGKMYKVQALRGGNLEYSHGTVDFTSLKPADSVLNQTPAYDGQVDDRTDLRNPHYNDGVDVGDNTIGNGYDYKYVGYGLESSITADTHGNGTLVHQFKLKDRDGDIFYVLCADYNTTAIRGADYSMTNVWEADYYDQAGAKKISAIAFNGYWGTDSGIGSLDNVKKFLKANSNLSQSMINELTPGEALTATQAAIWYYGHRGDNEPLSSTDATGKQYTGNYNGGWTFENADSNETARINALYTALINIDTSEVTDNSTELLTTKNFATQTQLVIKEKATNSDGSAKTDANGNEMYVGDLSFSLDVKKSDLTGNLKIRVLDENGKLLREEQLATDSSNLVGKILADGSVSSTENTYTIKDIELPEGTKINLSLSGTQNLAQGVYLYSAEMFSTSQTFVGVGSGKHDVNLNVNMEFSVSDPSAKIEHTSSSWSEKKTDKEYFSKSDSYKSESSNVSTAQAVTVQTDTYGTMIRSDVARMVTEAKRDWSSSYSFIVPSGDPVDPDEEEDPNEDVELADVPKTGNIAVLWLIMGGLSSAGLIVLNRKRS
ncbi:MAG: Cys-Gln thioester bond-forming surface protein [Oscillospiraceae bacterium]|nr:Cys-Gln thioester bond-forming surface protein [Oscillospiraceae bacterium]